MLSCNRFRNSFNQFVLNFNMNEINKTLPQLLGMLRIAEGNMKKGGSKSILMVREAKGKGKKVANVGTSYVKTRSSGGGRVKRLTVSSLISIKYSLDAPHELTNSRLS
ncbi:hypothetical protein V6N13_083127 [Hibiscus sabdariffa]